jgi:membrane protein YdbS with pleckstrin-like domain
VADPRRFLLPSERPVIQVRRHWAVLVGPVLQGLLLIAAGGFIAKVAGSVGFLRMLAVYFIIFVVAWVAWKFFDWYVERFIVTDKRVLLITGIIARHVAIMPLVKVTDLTFNRSAAGLMLGYGEFVVESAGQDQALSRVNHIPHPEKLYIQMSELLFGGDKGAPALPSPGERDADLEAGRALRRRRQRPWSGWRRRRGDPAPTANPERLRGVDDMLDQRDTVLLAEREYRRRPDPRLIDPETDEDPTAELPRIHDPRRDRGDGTFPPPRRWEDDDPPHAPPVDPADD